MKNKFQEYKENKSVNSKGEIVERTYYGKSKKIDREVISYVIRFTNGKVDKYEDRSDDSDFYLNYPMIGSQEPGNKACKSNTNNLLNALTKPI